ncbi:MAG: PHP domain-containing protein [Bacteroidota bacterium]
MFVVFMLDNHDISDIISQYAKLYELHNGNPFKVKSLGAAAYNIKKIGEPLADMSEEQLAAVPQLAKGLANKVYEIVQTGSFEELNDLIKSTPKGVIDILGVKGLGPKKVEVLWKEVGIAGIPELLDACRENRLVEVKGFGLKTQAQILKDIEFKFSNEGKFHWAKLQALVKVISGILANDSAVKEFEIAGDYRRLNDIVYQLDVLLVADNLDQTLLELEGFEVELVDASDNLYHCMYAGVLNIYFHLTTDANWGNDLMKYTATPEHLQLIGFNNVTESFGTEEQLYQSLNLPYILPELREGLQELSKIDLQDKLIQYKDLKGILHNHTTYSDGLHTLKEMADYAKSIGFEYLAICDHSQTAGYANGLKPERVLEQMKEMDALNAKMGPFKILKGIESDILGDGSLDYTTDILRLFDVVVASVHSNLNMDMEKAHLRLRGAIENPYTTILGHPTGRLLLMREGYPIHHEYIIDCCAANGVAIELNAHPYRLDVDWRWIDYAVNKGVLVSINPDAHQREGYHDMQYGVNVARKGYLTPEHCLNAKSLPEFEAWLQDRK